MTNRGRIAIQTVPARAIPSTISVRGFAGKAQLATAANEITAARIAEIGKKSAFAFELAMIFPEVTGPFAEERAMDEREAGARDAEPRDKAENEARIIAVPSAIGANRLNHACAEVPVCQEKLTTANRRRMTQLAAAMKNAAL